MNQLRALSAPRFIMLLSLAVASGGFLSTDSARASTDAFTILDEGGSLRAVTLELGGMHCAGCALKIRTALKSLAGISSLREGSSKKRLVIYYAPTKISPEKMVQKVEELGYQATVISGD